MYIVTIYACDIYFLHHEFNIVTKNYIFISLHLFLISYRAAFSRAVVKKMASFG